MDTAWPSEAEKDNITSFALDEQRPKITYGLQTQTMDLWLYLEKYNLNVILYMVKGRLAKQNNAPMCLQ